MSRRYTLLVCLCVQMLLLTPVRSQNSTAGPPPEEVILKAWDFGLVFARPGTAANFIEFRVDSTNGGDLFDVVSSDPRAAVSVILPDGTEVGAANAAALGFGFWKFPDGALANSAMPTPLSIPGTHTVFELPSPATPGTYKVKADASAVTDTTDSVAVIASYFSASPIRAGLKVEYQQQAGQPVVISALVLNGPAPVAGATVTASVAKAATPGVPLASVVLQDSGTGRDAKAGDGLYTGTFTPGQVGKYSVLLKAQGDSPTGVRFSRMQTSSFRVLEPLASFVAFQDAGADDDSDGLLDRVAVTSGVNVQKAGKYQFGLKLVAGNGREVSATAQGDLQTGAQEVGVSFSAEEILGLGVGGPYAMKEAILTYLDDPDVPVADFREDAGNTAAYSPGAMDRPELFFTGQGAAFGLDTNNNGKYDVLRVQAEVFVRFPGFYQWSGSIFDRNGREVDFLSGGGFLNAGGNTLTFNYSGSKIGRGGVSGPYALDAVTVLGGEAADIADHVLDTPAFSYKEFEDSDNLRFNAATATETDGDLDGFVEPGEDGSLAVRLSNVGAAAMTNVSATLTSSTPGVTVTAAQASYPALAPSGGASSNATPFAFGLGNVPCGQKLDFALTVSHAEDGGVPSVIHFSVRSGRVTYTAYGYAGPPVAVPDVNSAGVAIPITVSNFSGNIEDLNFRFDGDSCTSAAGATTVGLAHTRVSDLVVTLTSPQGTTVMLLTRPPSDGNNFCNTTLDDEGGSLSIQTINGAGAPYAGTFMPSSPLAAFRGQNANGMWTLRVSDRVRGETGSVRAFSLALAGPAACADNAAPKTNAARVPEPNAAGWNNTDAVVALSAADNKAGSGVREITYSASGAGAMPETTVAGPTASLTVAAEGVTTINFRATDNAGNVEATQSITVMVDKTAPSVNITSPSAVAYLLKQMVTAGYFCADGGSGLAACVGSAPDGGAVDTATAGEHTFTATATDAAGNTANASVVYRVLSPYDIRLLYDPERPHRRGSTIPVKIQIVDSTTGRNVSSPELNVHAVAVLKEPEAVAVPAEDAGRANPNDDFRFADFEGGGGYIFNLKTTDLTAGDYVLVFKVGNDPFTYRAGFRVR